MKKSVLSVLAVSLLGGALMSTTAVADSYVEVTITNLTKGITFTPALVASTRSGHRFFTAGDAASSELEIIAESGDPGPLADSLDSFDDAVLDFIGPGESDSVQILTHGRWSSITVASMLIPTNDAFLAVNGISAPRGRHGRTIYVSAYDAGTELNDELCASLPGPGCGGDPGPVSTNGEGYVYISNGIRGVGDLDADLRDWKNPVARITIRRIRN